MNSLFHLENAGVVYGNVTAVDAASATMQKGEFIAIAGPNGAGKSTLLSLLAGLAKPSSGTCRFLDRDAHRWSRRDFARCVAVVQQSEPSVFPFTAEEVVLMGRMPHCTGIYESAEDHAEVAKALAATGMTALAHRQYRTLSGGEKQRILLASALAQSPDVLLLDEPAAHLDLQHQVKIHQLLRAFSREGMLVVAVTHDLNLAAAYASRVLLMHEGRIRADGAPADVLHSGLLEEIFKVHVELHRRTSGQPWILYGE